MGLLALPDAFFVSLGYALVPGPSKEWIVRAEPPCDFFLILGREGGEASDGDPLVTSKRGFFCFCFFTLFGDKGTSADKT